MSRGRTDVEEVNKVGDAEQVSIRCGAGKLGRQLGVFVSWYDEGGCERKQEALSAK